MYHYNIKRIIIKINDLYIDNYIFITIVQGKKKKKKWTAFCEIFVFDMIVLLYFFNLSKFIYISIILM